MTNIIGPFFVGLILGVFSLIIPQLGLPDCDLVEPTFTEKCEQFVNKQLDWLKYLPPIFFGIGFFGSKIITDRILNESHIQPKDALGSKVTEDT